MLPWEPHLRTMGGALVASCTLPTSARRRGCTVLAAAGLSGLLAPDAAFLRFFPGVAPGGHSARVQFVNSTAMAQWRGAGTREHGVMMQRLWRGLHTCCG